MVAAGGAAQFDPLPPPSPFAPALEGTKAADRVQGDVLVQEPWIESQRRMADPASSRRLAAAAGGSRLTGPRPSAADVHHHFPCVEKLTDGRVAIVQYRRQGQDEWLAQVSMSRY